MRGEACVRGFEQNVSGGEFASCAANLQCGMGQLGILNGQDVLLHGRKTFCGEGKGLCSARKGMQAKNGAGDYSERSEGARNQFRQIVSRDIFYHFTAAAGERAIRKTALNPDA